MKRTNNWSVGRTTRPRGLAKAGRSHRTARARTSPWGKNIPVARVCARRGGRGRFVAVSLVVGVGSWSGVGVLDDNKASVEPLEQEGCTLWATAARRRRAGKATTHHDGWILLGVWSCLDGRSCSFQSPTRAPNLNLRSCTVRSHRVPPPDARVKPDVPEPQIPARPRW